MVTPHEFDQEWQSGDRDRAREMAREYVQAHASMLGPMLTATIEELVAMVTICRRNGDEENRIIADMVLQVVHGPQDITGTANIGGAAAVALAEAIIAEARNS